MSRTRKDSTSIRGTVLEIVKRPDGTLDLFLNHNLDRQQVQERWLPEWLCVRFGFCGKEYEMILEEVHLEGKATVKF